MDRDHHRQRRRSARLMLVLLFVTFSVAEALLWYFTNHRLNPWPFLRGHVVGGALITTVLLVGVWRRNLWARYVLIMFLWYLIAVFGIVAIVITNGADPIERRPAGAAITGTMLYLCGNVLLIRSRRLQHLAQPPGSGG
jgi:hypothetical protein